MSVVDELREWKLKHPNARCQFPRRIKDAVDALSMPGFNTRAEKLYAIFNNIHIRPSCVVCGGPASFHTHFLETCSVACAARNPSRKEKISATSLSRYGVSHPSLSEDVKKRTRATNMQRYGVSNPSQSDLVKGRTFETNLLRHGSKCTLNSPDSVIKKKATWIEKHGVDNPAKVPCVKSKMLDSKNAACRVVKDERKRALLDEHGIKALFNEWVDCKSEYDWQHITCGTTFRYHFVGAVVPRCPTCFPLNRSSEEQRVHELLRSHNIEFMMNTRQVIPPRELDIFIPSANLAIEINGVYWHHDTGTMLPLRDKTRLACAAGVQLLHFWDFEINNKFDIVANIIKAKLKLHTKTHARKLDVSAISSQEAAHFLNTHHLAGFARASIYLALKDGPTIKAVASFAANRFKKDGTWELVRFASDGAIVGGLSKLIAKFRSSVQAPLVSFADARLSTGEVYEKIGFQLNGLSKPNYFYARGSKRLHRQQAMKHKLVSLLPDFNEALSEHDNMTNAGWLRCFDCGSYKFTLP